MRHMNTWERLWEQLRESTEGPTVTLQVPREVADQLLNMLATSLEVDGDMDGEMDGMEPDDDDFGGPPDGDADDAGFSDMGDVPDFAAGDDDEDDDSDEEEPEDDDSDDDSDEDDDDETDEAADYAHSGGNPSGLRTQTALGESRRRTISEAYGWRTPSKRRPPARRK